MIENSVIKTCENCAYNCMVINKVDEGPGESSMECTHPNALDYDLEEGQECRFWKMWEQEEEMDMDWRVEE